MSDYCVTLLENNNRDLSKEVKTVSTQPGKEQELFIKLPFENLIKEDKDIPKLPS